MKSRKKSVSESSKYGSESSTSSRLFKFEDGTESWLELPDVPPKATTTKRKAGAKSNITSIGYKHHPDDIETESSDENYFDTTRTKRNQVEKPNATVSPLRPVQKAPKVTAVTKAIIKAPILKKSIAQVPPDLICTKQYEHEGGEGIQGNLSGIIAQLSATFKKTDAMFKQIEVNLTRRSDDTTSHNLLLPRNDEVQENIPVEHVSEILHDTKSLLEDIIAKPAEQAIDTAFEAPIPILQAQKVGGSSGAEYEDAELAPGLVQGVLAQIDANRAVEERREDNSSPDLFARQYLGPQDFESENQEDHDEDYAGLTQATGTPLDTEEQSQDAEEKRVDNTDNRSDRDLLEVSRDELISEGSFEAGSLSRLEVSGKFDKAPNEKWDRDTQHEWGSNFSGATCDKRGAEEPEEYAPSLTGSIVATVNDYSVTE